MWLDGYFPMFKNRTKKLYRYENNLEWQNNFMRLINTALSMFVWEGLPPTVSERYIEQALLFDGKFALVDDPNLGLLGLRVNPNSIFNLYGQYDKLSVWGLNGYNKTFTAYMEGSDNTEAQAVLCRDNNCMYPYFNYLIIAANRLTQSMRGIDTASKHLKLPYIIQCEEAQVTSVKALFNEVEENKPAIITTKGIDLDSIKVMPTGVNPAILQQMWDNFYKMENSIRLTMGIQNNSMPNKAERLLVDEVNSDNQQKEVNVDIRLQQRQLFCEQANELFGTDISVRFRWEDEQDETYDIRNMEEDIQPVGGE